ncbi:GTPase [Sorangium sp. So ce134]
MNWTNGIVGVGGIILSTIPLVGLSGNIAIATVALGIATATGAFGLVIWKALPPKQLDPTTLIGKKISVSDLENIDPPLRAVGIVGPGNAGKSTLVSRIAAETPPNELTEKATAQVTILQTNPPVNIALIDGRGNMYADQFTAAAPAEFLCILLDHSASDSDPKPDDSRIRDHIQFSEQLRGYLGHRKSKVHHVHLLMNKQARFMGTNSWRSASHRYTNTGNRKMETFQPCSFGYIKKALKQTCR